MKYPMLAEGMFILLPLPIWDGIIRMTRFERGDFEEEKNEKNLKCLFSFLLLLLLSFYNMFSFFYKLLSLFSHLFFDNIFSTHTDNSHPTDA